jgi:hypothetical protein
MTTMKYGTQEAPALGVGVAFAPTHRDDEVAAALRGYFPPADLEQLARLVGKLGYRRMARGKAPGQLHQLADLLAQASHPPVTPVAMRWYTDPTSTGVPLVCVLLDGDRAGEKTTIVPAGVQFRFDDPESIVERVYCQPVDDQHNNLGESRWSLDSDGRGVRVGAGTYLVPFDAIRTGDARTARRRGEC